LESIVFLLRHAKDHRNEELQHAYQTITVPGWFDGRRERIAYAWAQKRKFAGIKNSCVDRRGLGSFDV
jgi:hypothetical protein